jgi:hypothetical protein
LKTCCGAQWVVPIGGTIGTGTGCTDGGTIGHTVGGQIGLISIALLHTGCITPLMQRHEHADSAPEGNAMARATAAATRMNLRMSLVPFGWLVEEKGPIGDLRGDR